MPEDFTQTFLDTYFKAHAQKAQAQQFAQELQLRQQGQVLEGQKLGFERDKFGAEQSNWESEAATRKGTLQNAIDKLNTEKGQNDITNKLKLGDLLANQNISPVAPGTPEAGAAGTINIMGNLLRQRSPDEQTQDAVEKQAALARQKSYSDINDKVMAVHAAKGQIQQDFPDAQLSETEWASIMKHAVTGIADPTDDSLNKGYQQRLEGVFKARATGDPTKIKQAMDNQALYFKLAQPWLEEASKAAMAGIGLKQQEHTEAQNDTGDILNQMNDLGYDMSKSTGTEHEAAVNAAAGLVNAQRDRAGKARVNPASIQILNNMKAKTTPKAQSQFNFNFTPPPVPGVPK